MTGPQQTARLIYINLLMGKRKLSKKKKFLQNRKLLSIQPMRQKLSLLHQRKRLLHPAGKNQLPNRQLRNSLLKRKMNLPKLDFSKKLLDSFSIKNKFETPVRTNQLLTGVLSLVMDCPALIFQDFLGSGYGIFTAKQNDFIFCLKYSISFWDKFFVTPHQ